MGSPAPWRVRTFLAWLVLACLVPGVIGAGILFVREYEAAQAQRERDMVLTARALSQVVDSRLQQVQVLAQSLATAGALTAGDLPAFHRRARELIALSGVGANVVLTDERGQQIVNTLIEYGEPLPAHGNLALNRRIFATGRPEISDVYLGGVLRRPVMSIDVPVRSGERIVYDLSVGVLPEHFTTLLTSQGLPRHWVAAIFDASGTIVARTHAADKFVGQKGTAEFIRRIQEQGEGAMETVTREGIPTVASFSRSKVTGWSVGIGIPREELSAGLRGNLAWLGAGIAALFVAGLALAALLGERIASAVRALVVPARALGAGEPPEVPAVQTRETAEVAHAMGEAAKLLRTRAERIEEVNRSRMRSELRFRSTFEQAAVGMALLSLDGQWLQVNDRLCAITGHARDAFPQVSLLEMIDPSARATMDALLSTLAGSRTSFMEETKLRRADGSLAWVGLSVARVHAAEGEADYLVAVVQDIERRKAAEAQLERERESHRQQLEQQVEERTLALVNANRELERLAREDALTALQNRMSANERLHSEFVRLKRTGSPYALLVVDIDHFKRVNDTFGHEVGDRILREVAQLLVASLRESDFVARFGGEEFLAILPDTGRDGGMKSAEKIRLAVAAHAFPIVGRLTVSAGVGVATPTDASEDEALRRADAALYRAKNAGRNLVEATAAG